MVRELHKAGIEIILDVVFNHTAEGGGDGPILSFRGLDNRSTYWFAHHEGQPDYNHYINHSGCGNAVNLHQPDTLTMVLDALRYWVDEMQVDGFRFDLAVTLAREPEAFKVREPFEGGLSRPYFTPQQAGCRALGCGAGWLSIGPISSQLAGV